MKNSAMKILIGAVAVSGSLAIGAGAQAYWGGPWGGPGYEPWGGGPWLEPGWGGDPWMEPGLGGDPWSGPEWGAGPGFEPGSPFSDYGVSLDRMHERQSLMRDHRAAMRAVKRMLAGQRNFDRDQALALARDIETSAGDNLVNLFAPNDWQGSPLSRSRVGEDDMQAFKANADALKQAAANLVTALEQQPTEQASSIGRAWSPRMRGPYGHWARQRDEITPQVQEAFTALRATCHGCHASFRSDWR